MLVYPAIFHKAVEGGYIVIFPDFENGGTPVSYTHLTLPTILRV